MLSLFAAYARSNTGFTLNILLLQGPLGPFFARLTKALLEKNHHVFRIHFNAGDRFFSNEGHCTDYNKPLSAWPEYLSQFIRQHQIECVVLYGDCRSYHQAAISVARQHDCTIKVLEEGYLRPDWITCENEGVNAASSFLEHTDFTQEQRALTQKEKKDTTGNTFAQRLIYASLYFWAMHLQRRDFPHYQNHHINPSPVVQGKLWLKNFYRKYHCKAKDKQSLTDMHKGFGDRFYLLPLQVATDSQIITHSDFSSMTSVIESTIQSFARNAPKDTALLIKHHPVDRGHSHYAECINQAANDNSVSDRIFYGHDWSLPDLLRHTRGVVTLNSTVGISALIHHLPVKVLGRAFWNLPSITSQQTLDEFWKNPENPSRKKIDCLIASIRYNTQIKGSFYKNITRSSKALATHIYPSKLEMQEGGKRANLHELTPRK